MTRSTATVLPVKTEVLHAPRDDFRHSLGWCGKAAGCIAIIHFVRVRFDFVQLRYRSCSVQLTKAKTMAHT